jgi:hypothetical protein
MKMENRKHSNETINGTMEKFSQREVGFKPGENGWDKYMQLVGQAYMDAPDEQPEAVASYEALGELG